MNVREDIGRLLASCFGPDVAADFALRELTDEKGHTPIWRVSAGAGALRLIAKLVTPREYATHVLVAGELPDLLPGMCCVAGGLDTKNDVTAAQPRYLITEDLAARGFVRYGANAGAAFPISRCVAALAAIHARFAGKVAECERRGVPKLATPADADYAFAVELPDVVGALSGIFGVDVDDAAVAQLRKAGEHCHALLEPLHACQRLTLVHGDFHQANIMFDEGGDVRVLDWGSAGIAVPQWDLIMFDERQIAEYLECSKALGGQPTSPAQFLAIWRATTVFRMYQFMRSAAQALLTTSDAVITDPILDTFPVYVNRLLEAASPCRVPT